jgi:hypothetical protein
LKHSGAAGAAGAVAAAGGGGGGRGRVEEGGEAKEGVSLSLDAFKFDGGDEPFVTSMM